MMILISINYNMRLSLPEIKQARLLLDDFIIARGDQENIQLGKGSFADVY